MRLARPMFMCVLVGHLAVFGCSSPSAPAGPTSPSPPRPTLAPILLAGQSNAYFLRPFLPEAIDLTNIDGSVDDWLASRDFAQAARTPDLAALVWWQGGADVAMTTDEYAGKLRALITVARANHPTLPVRIVELVDSPDRANVRVAQVDVSRDAGVQLIPTGDLELADAGGHLTPAGYQTVRDRIYRSLGR